MIPLNKDIFKKILLVGQFILYFSNDYQFALVIHFTVNNVENN